jgi:hypothetical protein
LPSVGEATAENIIYFRAVQVNITKENLLTIKFVKESKQLLELIDFEPNLNFVSMEANGEPELNTTTPTGETEQTKQIVGNVEELLNAKNEMANEILGVNKESTQVPQ